MRRRLTGLFAVLALAWGGLAALALTDITPKLGLDLQGGTSVVLTAPAGTEEDVLEVAVDIMRRRIESFGGVQEPEIAISGAGTVLVQLPGVEDERRALDAVGSTGQLSFRPVLGSTLGEVGPLGSAATTTTTAAEPTTTTGDDASATTTEPAPTTTVPADLPPGLDLVTGLTVEDSPNQESYLRYGPEVLELGPAGLLGADVSEALPGFDTFSSEWIVTLDLTGEGGDKFASLTGEAARHPLGDPRRQIAIVLDGEVISAPQVSQGIEPGVGITGGRATITMGTFDTAEQDAQDLAVVLRYGSLPVSFERSQVSKVSATLGSDSLRIGLIAGVAGLLLVAVVLLAYYRALGLVAIVGLTVFGGLLISIFSVLGAWQGLTLTLAGVTGIIVSVGITTDSYIVYFERIKDEVRSGQVVTSAVVDGFKAAFRTILTADTVSLLGAGLLWILAVGPVKGFALSLGIATILDIFVARVFTRRAAWALAHSPLGDGGRFSIVAAAGQRTPGATVEVRA